MITSLQDEGMDMYKVVITEKFQGDDTLADREFPFDWQLRAERATLGSLKVRMKPTRPHINICSL
jgi:hypothetical protein